MNEREGYTPDERKRMLLSQETRTGIIITGTCIYYRTLPLIYNYD